MSQFSNIRIINRRTDKSLETTYIGRGSKWGNPYEIGRDGNREEVISAYRVYLWQMLKTREISLDDLRGLQGEVLGCYCKPRKCHGDVLADASDWAMKVDVFDPNVLPDWVLSASS